MDLETLDTVFFVGIGGISMSGLAEALMQMGITVAGSDISDTETIKKLTDMAADVHIGHDRTNISGADAVVYTTAIPEDNPELAAARAADIPIYHRSQLLASLCCDRDAVAVTGTHGKSTTTAMLAWILMEADADPTVFVGAQFPAIGGNMRLGDGDYAVFEACESDRSFLNYRDCNQVITSCEPDHLDQYGDFDSLRKAFGDFTRLADPSGFLAYNADSDSVLRIAARCPARRIGFSTSGGADISARRITTHASATTFELLIAGDCVGKVQLSAIGYHNVQNALAALTAAYGLGINIQTAIRAMATYRPVKRRFEQIGSHNGIRVIDDYAHHPTEIVATLRAARRIHDGRVIAVFQPHLRSRTRDLLEQFAAAFGDADMVILTEIYQPREDGLGEFDITNLRDALKQHEPQKAVEIVRDKAEIPDRIGRQLQPDDMVITVGAGDIHEIATSVLQAATAD